MILQLTLFALLMTSAAPGFADTTVTGCAAKREALQAKIETARQHGNSRQVAGLEKALAEVKANCTEAKLQSKHMSEMDKAHQEVQQRERDLRDALGQGDKDKIAKRQAKLTEAQAELKQAETELKR